MLKKSILGFFQLGSSRSEFATASANPWLTPWFAPGHPCPEQETLSFSAFPYEKRVGDLKGAYSRRINIQHRLVYQVIEDERIIKVLRLWTHYE